MLQMMAKKVTAEGEKEKELFNKFMCYCKNSRGDLQNGISGVESKIPDLKAKIKAIGESNAQLKATLKDARADRRAAKAAVSEAKAIREKESAGFAAEKGDADANIAAIKLAVNAIEKGMAGSFLQTSGAVALRKVLMNRQDMVEGDRQELLDFLSGQEHSG